MCIQLYLIIKALHELGIWTTSTIFSLKFVIFLELFAHVTGFKIQIYINHGDQYKLPNYQIMDQEDTLFHIFITDDILTYFLCKQSGHISTICKYNTESSLDINKTTKNPN